MKRFKVPAIIFTVIASICLAIFLISLITMLCLGSFESKELAPVILLTLAGMGIFGPATLVALVPMIVFWVLFGTSKKKLKNDNQKVN